MHGVMLNSTRTYLQGLLNAPNDKGNSAQRVYKPLHDKGHLYNLNIGSKGSKALKALNIGSKALNSELDLLRKKMICKSTVKWTS